MNTGMSTKNDLLESWCTWTGEPVPKPRHRIRVLSESGLLPARAKPLTTADMARAMLGFLVPDMHKEAANLVEKFCAFRCNTAYGNYSDEVIRQANLLDAIQIAFTSPNKLIRLSVSSRNSVQMMVIDNAGPMTEYYFSGYVSDIEDKSNGHMPVIVTKELSADLIENMLTLLTKETRNVRN